MKLFLAAAALLAFAACSAPSAQTKYSYPSENGTIGVQVRYDTQFVSTGKSGCYKKVTTYYAMLDDEIPWDQATMVIDPNGNVEQPQPDPQATVAPVDKIYGTGPNASAAVKDFFTKFDAYEKTQDQGNDDGSFAP